MKKQRKSPKARDKRSRQSAGAPSKGQTDQGRRNFLRLGRNIAIGAILVGGTGYVFASNHVNMRHEHDLTRVGNGRPTIVQIHDPQCSLCRSLQADARKALDMFEEEQLNYVVANIRTAKGKTFANRYGVPHVTLLLFDGKGDLQEVLQGQRGAYELRNHFQNLLDS
ncbi:hypothetical protein ABVF61_06285 [Roseibium sp. HPY-6]|uniref:hypothetical protein n=1 Tax=Roseibium sp. HPY-6 TaxID=3229852 RepID=UPI00338E6E7D